MQEFVDGSLHVFVAFDWGEEIALDTASQFAGASRGEQQRSQPAGDQYLARVHRLLAERLHLKGWEESVLRSLRVAEDVHHTVSEQAATYRTELLELTIILLIVVEIVLAFLAR